MKPNPSFVPLIFLAACATVAVLCGGCKPADTLPATPPTAPLATQSVSPAAAKATEATLRHDKQGN